MTGIHQPKKPGHKETRRLRALSLSLILVIWFVVGCSVHTATPIPPIATLTPEPPTSTPTVAPGGFPRRFHVEGNAFVDQYGQAMIFRGMAPIDPVLQALGGRPELGVWSEHHYHVMAEWGANIIRIPSVPDNLHNHGMDAVLRILDQTISWAAENKMYVIIDFHSIGWPLDNYYHAYCDQTSQQEIMDFWDAISRRYANNDTVAFYELFNEPATLAQSQWYITGKSSTLENWLEWKAFMDEIIAVIRANDPDKIILVAGMQFAYDLSHVAEAPIADKNIAYVTHPYSTQTNLNWDAAFGELSHQYPVFATELGYNQSDFPDANINGTPFHQAIIDYLEAHHISWTVWNFSASWPTTLLKNNVTYEPTESGAYFRSRMFELNFPGATLPTLQPTATSRPGNLARGKPVTASSIEGVDYPAKNAVDGNITTRWSSGFSDPQWIQVDLGDSYHINQVVLDWEDSYGMAYEIQVSSNGSEWETIYSTISGDGGIDDLNVSGSGRYVRIYGTSRVVIQGASYGYSLFEIEVYGVQ